jgi:hypothetical protein
MKIKFTLLALALLLGSCAKDNPTPEQPQNPELAKAQAIVDQALAELEKDYENPPVYEGTSSRAIVYLPAGSVNGLQNAISEAGWGGKVIVKSGDHWESGTVTIAQTVRIIGEENARIFFDVAAPGPFPTVTTNELDPAIFIKNVNMVWIKGLEIRPQTGKGSTGIFLEKGRLARIEDNTIGNFQFGIWASGISHSPSIYDNEITGYEGGSVWGIVIESGSSAKIKGNKVSSFGASIFVSDKRGIMSENETSGSSIGVLACTVQGNFKLLNGQILQNAIPCEEWVFANNISHDNYWNYLVIDGSHHNFLFGNEAWNPGLYDVELAGETYRFGAFSPLTHDNFVVNPNNGILTKDCGVNNVVLAGDKVNNEDDPCF